MATGGSAAAEDESSALLQGVIVNKRTPLTLEALMRLVCHHSSQQQREECTLTHIRVWCGRLDPLVLWIFFYPHAPARTIDHPSMPLQQNSSFVLGPRGPWVQWFAESGRRSD